MAFLPQRTFLEETIVSNYNLSNGVTSFTSSDISKYLTFSLQFTYTNVLGDNEFILEQSNDSLNWSDLSEFYTIPLGSGNFIIDKNTFSGKYLRINFNTSSIGILTINLLAKR